MRCHDTSDLRIFTVVLVIKYSRSIWLRWRLRRNAFDSPSASRRDSSICWWTFWVYSRIFVQPLHMLTHLRQPWCINFEAYKTSMPYSRSYWFKPPLSLCCHDFHPHHHASRRLNGEHRKRPRRTRRTCKDVFVYNRWPQQIDSFLTKLRDDGQISRSTTHRNEWELWIASANTLLRTWNRMRLTAQDSHERGPCVIEVS